MKSLAGVISRRACHDYQALHEPSLLCLLSQRQYVKTRSLALDFEVKNEIFNVFDRPDRLPEH